MKHLFNFTPPVKFRVGSTFMFKTILFIIWSVPLVLVAFVANQYILFEELEEDLANGSQQLERKHSEFQKKLAENRPSKAEMNEFSARILAYFNTLRTVSFSWSSLLETLENLLPAGVKVTRILVKPGSCATLVLEGEARSVEQVTEFWRRLYAGNRFDRPRVSRHALIPNTNPPIQQFHLEVDYIPSIEVQP